MKRMSVNNTKKGKTVEECFKEFLIRCKRKNLSVDTIRSYKTNTARFFKYFEGVEINLINQQKINEFTSYLQDEVRNPISVNNYLRHTRSFLRFSVEEGCMNPVKIEFLRVQKTVKDCYTDEELSRLLNKPNLKKCSFSEYRNWVIICFLLTSACRQSTLTEIRNEDIDFDNGLVKFRHTKNKKIQFIPLNDHLLGVLEKFQFVRKGEPSDYLFCNSFGKKLLTNGIYSAIKRYNLSRGVFKTSTHLFRHTFAKNWIMEGGDIAKLQRMLGHETLEMSVHYANMYGINVLKNTEKFNLYSRLKQPDRIKLK